MLALGDRDAVCVLGVPKSRIHPRRPVIIDQETFGVRSVRLSWRSAWSCRVRQAITALAKVLCFICYVDPTLFQFAALPRCECKHKYAPFTMLCALSRSPRKASASFAASFKGVAHATFLTEARHGHCNWYLAPLSAQEHTRNCGSMSARW